MPLRGAAGLPTTASLMRSAATLWLDSRSSAMQMTTSLRAMLIMSAGSASVPNAASIAFAAARFGAAALKSTCGVPMTSRASFCAR